MDQDQWDLVFTRFRFGIRGRGGLRFREGGRVKVKSRGVFRF